MHCKLPPPATTLKAKVSLGKRLGQDGGRSCMLASGPYHGPVLSIPLYLCLSCNWETQNGKSLPVSSSFEVIRYGMPTSCLFTKLTLFRMRVHSSWRTCATVRPFYSGFVCFAASKFQFQSHWYRNGESAEHSQVQYAGLYDEYCCRFGMISIDRAVILRYPKG